MGVGAIGGDPRGVEHRLIVAEFSRFWTECFDLGGVEFPGVLGVEERAVSLGSGRRDQTQDAEYEEDTK